MILSQVPGPKLLLLHPKSFNLVRCGLLLVISAKQRSIVVTLSAHSTPGMSPTTEPRPRRQKKMNLSVLAVGWLRESANASIRVSIRVADLSSSVNPTLLVVV